MLQRWVLREICDDRRCTIAAALAHAEAVALRGEMTLEDVTGHILQLIEAEDRLPGGDQRFSSTSVA